MIWDRAGERILDLVADPGGGGLAARAAHPDLQEQHRLQGQLLRHPRELPDGPQGALRAHRPVPDAVLRDAARSTPARARWGPRTTPSLCDYQISQRADFLETEVGLETMHSRPIINTRDEPHADPEKYRRLHVIVGDANMSEVSTYLKMRHHGHRAQHDRGRLHRPRPRRSTARSPPTGGCRAT